MRFVCILMVAALSACNDGVAPPILIAQDMSVPAENDQGIEDLAKPADLLSIDLLPSVDLMPKPCKTACDCPSGEHCATGACTAAMPMIFCCGAADCTTASAVCETPTGLVRQCGDPDGGIFPDLGPTATPCANVACLPGTGGNVLCTLACGKTATCKTNGGGMNRCSP